MAQPGYRHWTLNPYTLDRLTTGHSASRIHSRPPDHGPQCIQNTTGVGGVVEGKTCAVLCLIAQLCLTLGHPMDCSPPGFSVHGIFQTQLLAWVAMPSLQGIFPTQGLNPDLPHCKGILYPLSYQGNPRILQWVAYPFSRGSSWPGIEPGSPALQADSFPAELPGKP